MYRFSPSPDSALLLFVHIATILVVAAPPGADSLRVGSYVTDYTVYLFRVGEARMDRGKRDDIVVVVDVTGRSLYFLPSIIGVGCCTVRQEPQRNQGL